MTNAQGDEVVDGGRSTVLPRGDVVELAAVGRNGAAGKRAVTVPEAHGVTLRKRGQALTATEVEDLRPAAEDGRDHQRVAQQPAQLTCREASAVGQDPCTVCPVAQIGFAQQD